MWKWHDFNYQQNKGLISSNDKGTTLVQPYKFPVYRRQVGKFNEPVD